jgi:hypothetical protein
MAMVGAGDLVTFLIIIYNDLYDEEVIFNIPLTDQELSEKTSSSNAVLTLISFLQDLRKM